MSIQTIDAGSPWKPYFYLIPSLGLSYLPPSVPFRPLDASHSLIKLEVVFAVRV